MTAIYAKSMTWSQGGVVKGHFPMGNCSISQAVREYDKKVLDELKTVTASIEMTLTETTPFRGIYFLMNPYRKCYFARQSMTLKQYKKYLKIK